MTLGRFEDVPQPDDPTARLLRLSGADEPDGADGDRVRLADEWVGRRLKELDYDLGHPESQHLADHLCALGVGTLINLKKTGRLFRRCAELGIRGLPSPPDSWRSESDRVIVVAVRAATQRFITERMPHWDSTQSSIRTYFVNYCLIRFKPVYLQYCKEERQGCTEMPAENIVDLFEARAAYDGVEDLAIARQTIREVMRLMGDQDFDTLVRLTAAGRSRAEIAATLDISMSTLERRIAQYRKRLRTSGWSEGQVSRS